MANHEGPAAPARDCSLCPRLAHFRDANQASYPDFFNAPVPSFGDRSGRLLIVGLAPGLKGANRTGRPFTGDYAGDLLYATLDKFGYSQGTYNKDPNDGLELTDCRITNAVRCVPPENKPTTPEIKTCQGFLNGELQSMSQLRAILALGSIAHGAVLSTLGRTKAHYRFGHAAAHQLDEGLTLFDSYHCSRYNTNTGRLTPAMFESVFHGIRVYLNS